MLGFPASFTTDFWHVGIISLTSSLMNNLVHTLLLQFPVELFASIRTYFS